ncbi:MAG: hypothetical protein RLZZ561_385 [Pseudomonadota bacterium]|jgi:hypothetical protein
MPLHLTKVAFGATGMPDLIQRVEARAQAGEVRMTTRYLPKHHAEIEGAGSLYWIVRHQLIARARIIRFDPTPDGRIDIVLEARVIPVRPAPRRAHQGWRYLEDADAPEDLGGLMSPEEAILPPALLSDLAELGLI